MTQKHPLANYVAPLTGIDESEKERIIKEGLSNLESGLVALIGFSGKKGAGKDTLATSFLKALDGKAELTPISTGIKNEASEMFEMIYSWIDSERKIHASNVKSGKTFAHMDISGLVRKKQERHERHIAEFAKKFDTSHKHAQVIYTTIYPLLKSHEGITGYNRENEVIAVLQYLGKDVRQPQDDVYWTRKMLWNALNNASQGLNSLIPDVRFTHDAEALKECGAFIIRADITRVEQLKRLKIRDGVEVSNAILDHPGETALDDYQGFDLRFDSSDKTPEESFEIAWQGWENRQER